MDPQCMFGGHDLSYLTWIFACRIYALSHLYYEYGNAYLSDDIIVLYFLVCWQGSNRLFLVPYTHSTNYFSYHSILTSYFGGLSITNYFHHPYER